MDNQSSYQLIDCGHGQRLERFGNNVVMRPEKMATFAPSQPIDEWVWDAKCEAIGKGRYKWTQKPSFEKDWMFSWKDIRLNLRARQSLNVGVFPEQMKNWEWVSSVIPAKAEIHPRQPRILNLFGYTGGATLVMAKAGAHVTHVDSAKTAISWGKENQKSSGLDDRCIRWICDDALTFIHREIKRGNKYDGIILDPPAFGRSAKGPFKFEDSIHDLLKGCEELFSNKPLFLLLNCYATGLGPKETGRLLGERGKPKTGWLSLTRKDGKRALNCSTYARVENLERPLF